MQQRTGRGMALVMVELGLGLGLMAGCGQRPYRAFAVEVASAPPPPDAGEAPAAAALGAGLAPRGAVVAVGTSGLRAQHPKWDLNRVSAATLARLPGIDAATVAAMVGGRPYKAKRELLRRKILTAAQYARWKDYLVVHRGTTKATE